MEDIREVDFSEDRLKLHVDRKTDVFFIYLFGLFLFYLLDWFGLLFLFVVCGFCVIFFVVFWVSVTDFFPFCTTCLKL